MEKLLLSEIAEALGTIAPFEKEITAISTDTRNLPEGCLFVAIKGDRFDGHDFIPKALESGAVVALSEKNVDGCACVVVDDTRKAYLALSGYYRRKFHPILVGVTGSVGKTTTKEMIALVLSEKYKTLKTQGNFNNEIGLPRTLFNLDSSYDAAVIEMGMSHFGEISRLSKTALPTTGVITNIGFSHIENLKSQDGILKAKLEILDGMQFDSPLIVNGDDEHLGMLKKTLSENRPVYYYGAENSENDFYASNIHEDDSKTFFELKYSEGKAFVEIPCVGKHNVLNAAAAFAVGIINGLKPDEIVSALKKYKPDGMRQNIVDKNGITVIIDCYNASPDSMKASLNVLSDIKCSGRKIAVLGDMLELGTESERLHSLVGNYVHEANPDMLFCYGKDSRFIAENCGIRSEFSDDKTLLTKEIRTYIKEGDAILFKASRGMKLEEIINALFDKED